MSHCIIDASQTEAEEEGWVVEEPEELGAKVLQPRSRQKKRRAYRYALVTKDLPFDVFYIPPKAVQLKSYEIVPSELTDIVTERPDGKYYGPAMVSRGYYKVVHRHSTEELAHYKHLTNMKPLKEVMVSGFNTILTAGDMRTLQEGRPVKDSVLNYYMSLLQDCTNTSYDSRLCIQSHFFVRLLLKEGFMTTEQASGRKVNGNDGKHRFLRSKMFRVMSEINWRDTKRWFRRRDLFRRRRLLIPIFHPPPTKDGVGHWTLMDAEIAPVESGSKRKQVKVWLGHRDSLEGIIDNEHYLQAFGKFLDLYHYVHRGSWLNSKNIVFRKRLRTPQQHNGVDCGVHVCAMAYCLCHRIPIEHFTTSEQIQNFRVHMALSIREHRLTDLIRYGPRDVVDT